MRGNSLLRERTRISVFHNVQGNLPQKIPTSTTSRRLGVAEQLPQISCQRSTPRENLLEPATTTQKRKPEDKMEDLDVNTLIWRMFMIVTRQAAVHLGNDYFGEMTVNQKSVAKNSETIVRCDKKVDQRTERDSRYIHDRLATQFLEKDDFVKCPCSPVITSESLWILRFSIVHGQNQCKSRKRMDGENQFVYEFIPVSRIGSNRRGADGVRVDKFTRIYCIADCRRDPEHDDWKEMWTWAISRKNHLHVNV